MNLKTLKDLDDFMKINCYNLDIYSVGEQPKYDGFGIEKWGELFVWFYVERGERENLNYFASEQEAVIFVYNIISKDKFAKSNLLTSVENPKLKEELIEELNSRNIKYWTDEIPYLGKYNKLTRFFIIGCDIKKAISLLNKFKE
jgi:hypothetical protein